MQHEMINISAMFHCITFLLDINDINLSTVARRWLFCAADDETQKHFQSSTTSTISI